MRLELSEEEYVGNGIHQTNGRASNTATALLDKIPDREAPDNEHDHIYRKPRFSRQDENEFVNLSADQEWVCEMCGAEIPPNGRYCAACGHATDASASRSIFKDIGVQMKQWLRSNATMANQYGLTTASLIALAVAIFCVAFAVVVQFSIPTASPVFSQTELFQAYAIRTMLWLLGSIVALVAAILFKRDSRIL